MPHAAQHPNHRTAALFALGALLGLAVFLAVYGTAPLDVTNDSFCRSGYIEKDIQQHYAGWLFYRQSAIGWPLCVTQSVNAPQGLSVAYTDSIPLLAALCRPLANALGGTFQYFGWFTAVCFALQGGFGALLCGLFSVGVLQPTVGCALFVTVPVLIERAFRHTSLGAQWLVLAALYFYFSCRRAQKGGCAGLFLVNVLTVGIHPYFAPMTFAVTLALLLEHGVRTHRVLRPTLFLGGNLACTAALAWALGFFYGSAGSGGQALYGYFAMNLNALWNPAGVNGVLYSRLLPAQNTVNGNYDAFAYLGLGVLLALPIVLITARKRLLSLIRAHWALCLVCAVLTAFAISHTVTANGVTLCTLPLPDSLIKLFSVFRSGGRLFWPVYYLLLLSAFAGLCRLPKAAVWVLVLAVVQVWDVSPAMAQRHAAMQTAQTSEAFPTALQSDFWQTAGDTYHTIASMDSVQDDALHLALLAADCGMTTNDPFAARYDAAALAENRAALSAELADGTLRADTLYLFEDEGAFLQAVEPVKDKAWCGRVTSTDGTCNWYVIAPGLQGQSFDALCTPYGEAYPLRLADYTDALWNRGVLDSTRQTVCFADAPFTRAKLEHAAYLCADGQEYAITKFDDHDTGWLMITLEIDDATVLWDRELTTK